MTNVKRFRVCRLPGPAEGRYDPQTEAVDGGDFATKGEALDFVRVFPGSGYGYIWDEQEQRAVHAFSWERKAKAN
jgi:hypothetical protein